MASAAGGSEPAAPAPPPARAEKSGPEHEQAHGHRVYHVGTASGIEYFLDLYTGELLTSLPQGAELVSPAEVWSGAAISDAEEVPLNSPLLLCAHVIGKVKTNPRAVGTSFLFYAPDMRSRPSRGWYLVSANAKSSIAVGRVQEAIKSTATRAYDCKSKPKDGPNPSMDVNVTVTRPKHGSPTLETVKLTLSLG